MCGERNTLCAPVTAATSFIYVNSTPFRVSWIRLLVSEELNLKDEKAWYRKLCQSEEQAWPRAAVLCSVSFSPSSSSLYST